MPSRIACPTCKLSGRLPEGYAKARARCPRCGTIVVLAQAVASTEEEETATLPMDDLTPAPEEVEDRDAARPRSEVLLGLAGDTIAILPLPPVVVVETPSADEPRIVLVGDQDLGDVALGGQAQGDGAVGERIGQSRIAGHVGP